MIIRQDWYLKGYIAPPLDEHLNKALICMVLVPNLETLLNSKLRPK